MLRGKFFRLVMLGFVLGASLIWVTVSYARRSVTNLRLAAGEWQLSERDGPRHQHICIADPVELALAPKGRSRCRSMMMENAQDVLIIHFECPSVGKGRSVLRVIDDASGRLETQGISHGEPFATDYDARRLGACSPLTTFHKLPTERVSRHRRQQSMHGRHIHSGAREDLRD